MNKRQVALLLMALSTVVAALLVWTMAVVHTDTHSRPHSTEESVRDALQRAGISDAALQTRLAAAHSRLRQQADKVQQAQQVLGQDERRQRAGQQRRGAPVEVQTVERWEEWQPSEDRWFKTAGESDEAFAQRLSSLQALPRSHLAAAGARPRGQAPQSSTRSSRLRKLRFRVTEDVRLQLHPAFRPGVFAYSVYVDADCASVEMLAEAESPAAEVTLRGRKVALPRSALPLRGGGAPEEQLQLRVHLYDVAADSLYNITFWRRLPPGSALGDYVAARSGSGGKECRESRDCHGQQVCVWGRCKCPVLYSGKVGGGGGCAPSQDLPSWCLRPVGGIPLADLFDAPHGSHAADTTAARGLYAPAYSPQLAVSRFFKGMASQSRDILLHAADKLGKDLALSYRPEATGALRRRQASKPAVAHSDLPDARWGIDWGRCAVVGGSSALSGRQLGAVIDDHTAVIRVGDHPTIRHEADVGRRTSVRRQSPETAGFSEGRGAGRGGAELCVVNVRSFRGGELRRASPGAKCTYVELSPQFEQYTRYYWQVHKAPGPPGRVAAAWSPEFTALALAMHVCGQVDVFGLSPASAAQPPYSLDIANLADSPSAGNGVMEAACLKEMQAAGAVAVF